MHCWVVIDTHHCMRRLVRLHLNDEVSSALINILWVENAAISLKSTASFMPSTAIEGLEVVSPLEFELIAVLIKSEYFDIVVHYKPGHAGWIEAFAPRVESRCPEVHSQRLRLRDVFGCFIIFT